MRSIESRFIQIQEKQPGLSSFIAFMEAIRGQKFSTETIHRWFKKLVEKDDYASCQKKDIFKHMLSLNMLEDTRKRG